MLAACSVPSPPPPATAPAAPAEPRQEDVREEDRAGLAKLLSLDLPRAQAIVAELEARWPRAPASDGASDGASDPLASPQSLDDVLAILKRDQVTLFGAATEYLAGQEGQDALALHGQIELAWGESYLLLVDLMTRLRRELMTRAEALRGQGDAGGGQPRPAWMAWIEASAEELALRSAALELVAIEHIAAGSERAEQLIEQHPDSYLGYRLMADYYRTLRDWESFDAMVARITETNPRSNGLVFLRGAAAFQRRGDVAAAAELYREALVRDPDFVRAQAHLLVIQPDLSGARRELAALAALNPHHPLVVEAAEAIERAYEAERAADPR